MANLCEYIRQQAVGNLFKMGTMRDAWPVWQKEILARLGPATFTAKDVIGLGDHLSDIFASTGQAGRGQGSVSGGGAGWEALVCWYANFCLIGTRGVVIKQAKGLIPEPFAHAVTVKYHNFKSNTESDLMGITFPDKTEYTGDLGTFAGQATRSQVPFFVRDKLNYKPLISDLTDQDFGDTELSIIQCKTNWNDNAQIPMLWDMIYRTKEFADAGIIVGDKSYKINDLQAFRYAFVTVPSNKRGKYKADSTSVQRVRYVSGGNYWGKPSFQAVAESVAEIFGRNFPSAFGKPGHRSGLAQELAATDFSDRYGYFGL